MAVLAAGPMLSQLTAIGGADQGGKTGQTPPDNPSGLLPNYLIDRRTWRGRRHLRPHAYMVAGLAGPRRKRPQARSFRTATQS